MGDERKTVVVVGGGVAGSLIAKGLELNADVVLVDPEACGNFPACSVCISSEAVQVAEVIEQNMNMEKQTGNANASTSTTARRLDM